MIGSSGFLLRFGLFWGASALVALLVAFTCGSWLYTDCPVSDGNCTRSKHPVMGVTVGLWSVCLHTKHVNTTDYLSLPTCIYIKWNSTRYPNPEQPNTVELAEIIVSRTRCCTLLYASAILITILSLILALSGLNSCDFKVVIACGTYILSGLLLGTGLVLFVTYLAEALIEVSYNDKQTYLLYHYGWCFYLATTSFLLTNAAAIFSMLGYLSAFATVDEMVKNTVPGGKRKLEEYVCIQNPNVIEPGARTSRTPPDVCSTSYCPPVSEQDYSPTISEERRYVKCTPSRLEERNYMIQYSPSVSEDRKYARPGVHSPTIFLERTGKYSPSVSEQRKYIGQTVPIRIKKQFDTLPPGRYAGVALLNDVTAVGSCSSLDTGVKTETMHVFEAPNKRPFGSAV